MTDELKGKQDLFFAIGPATKKITSAIGSATMIICGKEDLTPASVEPINYSLEVD